MIPINIIDMKEKRLELKMYLKIVVINKFIRINFMINKFPIKKEFIDKLMNNIFYMIKMILIIIIDKDMMVVIIIKEMMDIIKIKGMRFIMMVGMRDIIMEMDMKDIIMKVMDIIREKVIMNKDTIKNNSKNIKNIFQIKFILKIRED
jgi:hypothetical protein